VHGITTIGIVSGFAALFTSTLGGSAIACAHPSAGTSFVVGADAARSIGDIRQDLSPAQETARLSAYAKFAHAALDALSAKAAGLADEISTAGAKDAPAALLDRASSARSAALVDLAAAKQALANADAALADGSNLSAARALRATSVQLHQAMARLGVTRMVVGMALHAAFLAAKAARLASFSTTAAKTDVLSLDADPFDGHHCDGFGDPRLGDGSGWDGDWGHDGYHHDGYHRDWHR
jgi:hypothetical protein